MNMKLGEITLYMVGRKFGGEYANRDKMRAIGGTYRYIKPSDRCQIIKLPEDVCKNF